MDTTPIGGWHSVVAVLSATKGDALNQENIQVYIDGRKTDGSIKPTWAPAKRGEADGCLIGAAVSGDQAHQNLHFEGVIDEMQLFSPALTEQEIQIYNAREP